MTDHSGEHDGKVIKVTGRRCPLCGRPAIVRFWPFCSRRCADEDLGKWLNGRYRIASDDKPDDGEFEES